MSLILSPPNILVYVLNNCMVLSKIYGNQNNISFILPSVNHKHNATVYKISLFCLKFLWYFFYKKAGTYQKETSIIDVSSSIFLFTYLKQEQDIFTVSEALNN